MIPTTPIGRLSVTRFSVLVVGVLAVAGCASYQVTVPDSDPIQLEGQEAEYVERTMHGYFWGFVLDPQVLAADCQGQGINDVVVDRTLGHDLAGVFTLGIWMPMDVRFRCKAPPTRPGVIPLPPSQ